MSKMVNPVQKQRPFPIRLILCLLIGCLLAHFLMEDVSLLPGLPAAEQTAAGANPVGVDEFEHQDDLVVLPVLPLQITNNETLAVFAWIVPLQKQAVTPLLQPPQI